MQTNWPTEEKDLEVAKNIIEGYVRNQDDSVLALLEFVVSHDKEAPDVRLAEWVVTLTDYFQEKYGCEQGDIVTKKVIGRCMTYGKAVH